MRKIFMYSKGISPEKLRELYDHPERSSMTIVSPMQEVTYRGRTVLFRYVETPNRGEFLEVVGYKLGEPEERVDPLDYVFPDGTDEPKPTMLATPVRIIEGEWTRGRVTRTVQRASRKMPGIYSLLCGFGGPPEVVFS